MLPLGTKLPDFSLINTVNNQYFSGKNLRQGRPILIMFICNHCPFVIHYHSEISLLAKEYGQKINFVAISANDAQEYPEDAPEEMQKLANRLGWEFPYLYDESQEVAKKFGAQCTPDFFLFDKENSLIYRGRLDDSTPGNNKEVTGKDLRNAFDDCLSNQQIESEQFPSMGCNIKWRNYANSTF